jgi:hypothetical protein
VKPRAVVSRHPGVAVFRATARGLLMLYSVAVVVALVVAWRRLTISTEMPGLAAIELVLLALPWSLALAHYPVAHAPLMAGAAVVAVGAALNALVLVGLARAAERTWSRRALRGRGGEGSSPPVTDAGSRS